MTRVFTSDAHQPSILSEFCRHWYDDLGARTSIGPIGTRLLTYAPRLLNTSGTPAQERRRAWLVIDWLVREFIPAWLEAAGLTHHARALRALPEQNSVAALANSQMVRDAARDAAEAIPGDTDRTAIKAVIKVIAGNTAGNAAGNMIWDDTWYADGEAVENAEAAEAATWYADGAVRAAIQVATEAAIEDMIMRLQESAFALLDRMIAVEEG